MLPQHKNALYEAIQGEGLSPQQFQLTETARTLTVNLAGTHLAFVIEQSPKDILYHRLRYSQYRQDAPLTAWYTCHAKSGDYGCTISRVISKFSSWLKDHVKPHLDAQTIPDLWVEAVHFGQLFSSGPFSQEDMRPFTTEERRKIRHSILRFKVLLTEHFETSEEQLRDINQRLDYLSERLDRLNRFDWQGTLLNTTISIVTALSLDTEKGRQLFVLLSQAFDTLKNRLS